MSTVDTDTREKINSAIDHDYKMCEPSLYKVIYINDDVTTFEFVVASLITIFNHSTEEAIILTKKVNDEDSAIVSILPHELAEQKGVEATMLARKNGYPLQVRLEVAD